MRIIKALRLVLGLTAAVMLGACTAMNAPSDAYSSRYAGSASGYPAYGVVQSIEVVRQDGRGGGIGLGTLAGAVVGGVVGHQVGSGRGNTAATVIGAAGGAYVGHELEGRQEQRAVADRITVRMDDGSYRTLTQRTDAAFRVGDRVRVGDHLVQRY